MNEDQKEILAVYQQIDEAMVTKNTAALEEILDKNYMLVHMSGYPQRKQEWLDQIENEQMRYFKTLPQKTDITVDGDTAVLRCHTKIDAKIYGIRNLWSMILEMHFEKRGDRWCPLKAIATSN